MCSLTWLRRPDGYELFFSRDESRRRLPAHPPALQRRGGVEFLAPRDADAGGTWLALNAWGVTVCLLNGPEDGPEPRDPISRGLLVLELADARDGAEVARQLAQRDLSPHKPFQLVTLDPFAPLQQAVWHGDRLALEQRADDVGPLTSSSLEPIGAGRSRRELLQRMLAESGPASEELLLAFHSSHEPEQGALSPCMHREDAETVSFARTRVTSSAVELGYSPAAPCRRQTLTWLSLERLQRDPPARVAPGS